MIYVSSKINDITEDLDSHLIFSKDIYKVRHFFLFRISMQMFYALVAG